MKIHLALLIFLVNIISINEVCAYSQTSLKEKIELIDKALEDIHIFDVEWQSNAQPLLEMIARRDSEGKMLIPPTVDVTRRYPPDALPPARVHKFRQIWTHGKGRIEVRQLHPSHSYSISVYDGEAVRSYQYEQKLGSITKDLGRNEGTDYNHFIRYIMHRSSIIHMLQRRPGVTFSNSITDDIESTIFEIPITTSSTNKGDWPSYGFKICFRHNPRPYLNWVETSREYKGRINLMHKIIITKSKDIGNGLRVPIEMVQSLYTSIPGEFQGSESQRITYTVNESSSSWNKPVSDEVWKLPFPKGTRVLDDLRKLEYVTGNPDPNEHLSDLAKSAKEITPLRSPPPPPAPTNSYLAWFLATTFALGLGWIGYRYWRNRGNT